MTAKTILVVDDDADIRVTLAELLMLEGFQTLMASNGEEAINILSAPLAQPVSLVLLDLMMPVMNGKEFLTARSLDPQLANVPVLVLSAGTRPTDLPANLTFLKKPLDAELLFKLIHEHI